MKKPLFGEYDCKVDAKGRFLFPSVLLSFFEEEEQNDFVINKGMDSCLVLYPQQVWEQEIEKIYSKNQFLEKNRAFARMFQSGAQPVRLDNQKRILIPKKLLECAEIQNDIVLIGAYDRIEIWSKEKFEAWLNVHQQNFANLSEEVMKDE
jgi:MraZ protein